MSENLYPYDWEGAVETLRNDPAAVALTKAAYYDDPIISAAKRYYKSGEWNEVCQYTSSSDREGTLNRLSVLDVGAGRGIASYAFARDGFEVTALEPDQSEIVGSGVIRELANESGLDIEICDVVSTPLNFDDESFDVIFARAVLHHIPNLNEACKDFQRLLRPGGKFIAIREHVLSKNSDLNEFLKNHPLHSMYGGEHAYTLEHYETCIENAGFKLFKTLSPLESEMNYGPSTTVEMKMEIAIRLVRLLPLSKETIFKALQNPFLWSLLLPILKRIDNRPGRLYSFVAIKV